MIFLPLLFLPLVGWLVDGAPWYLAAGGWLTYGVGYSRWLSCLCRSALSAR